MEYIPLKPWRQTWLSLDLLHSAPAAELCVIDGKQWAQLAHPRGGPLTCVQNRTGRTATGVARVDGKWCWAFEGVERFEALATVRQEAHSQPWIAIK